MIRHATGHHSPVVDVDLDAGGAQVVFALEASRATWQVWHVRAEAQRQARAAQVPLAKLDETVDQLVTHVLDDLSVRLDSLDPANRTRGSAASGRAERVRGPRFPALHVAADPRR